MEYTDLDDFLKSHASIERKKKLLLFTELIYKPTGEKVLDGFRYFNCDMQNVLEPFQRGDFAAIEALPFALDDDGEADTSAVRLDVAFTASGSMVAAQPVEFQNYNPTRVAEVLMLEGAAAKKVVDAVNELDQTR